MNAICCLFCRSDLEGLCGWFERFQVGMALVIGPWRAYTEVPLQSDRAVRARLRRLGEVVHLPCGDVGVVELFVVRGSPGERAVKRDHRLTQQDFLIGFGSPMAMELDEHPVRTRSDVHIGAQ